MDNTVIFCDFDGTVTEKDNIVRIMNEFAPPGWENLKEEVLTGRMTIKEGVGAMFSLLPTARKAEISEYAIKHAIVRPGFSEFVAFTREEKIPLYIVSGGIDFFVYPTLEKYGPFSGVYCNTSDFSGKTIKVSWPHECDELCLAGCGLCKPSIMRKLAGRDQYKIVIGDSVTDFAAASEADFVLARDFLQGKCEELGIRHSPFHTFYDCLETLRSGAGVIR
ncbi:2-hydroxy-3-keto-5-methylthiopentenyl-1-phosphate phosphatase [Mesobacillus zeae]|uniref:2-hydroxy-3-keto-5-methylthiopentenyl-1-phosphate phosphatase n=1 Tax=Mesobacillus zeae TaxID=1917180 RepID=A0A398BCA1_9BACI|nr:2-hydroxy-3-keto-5-methylthiopentenyl-1-phosphate phosphatase [Mesobacillus zeae]